MLTKGFNIGGQHRAIFQGVSEIYLSKVFTKLRKAGVIRSVSGAKGGYALAYDPEHITFLDIVEAIEGKTLTWLRKQANEKVPHEHGQATTE